jgi:hypothetical protein
MRRGGPSRVSFGILSGVMPTAPSVIRQFGLGVPPECFSPERLAFLQGREHRKGVTKCACEQLASLLRSRHLSLRLKAHRLQRSAGAIGVGDLGLTATQRLGPLATTDMHLELMVTTVTPHLVGTGTTDTRPTTVASTTAGAWAGAGTAIEVGAAMDTGPVGAATAIEPGCAATEPDSGGYAWVAFVVACAAGGAEGSPSAGHGQTLIACNSAKASSV